MRASLFLLAGLLCACAEKAPVAAEPRSACEERAFEGSSFTVCSARGEVVEVRSADKSGQPYRSFAALESALGGKARRVSFAMNAGMFDEQGRAIGLLVEDGKQLHAINRRKGGGNFHLLPNGVFLIRNNGKAEVVASDAYSSSVNVRFATQSGPMLVIDGKLHPKFDADGQSRYIRNGVGIAPDGAPLFVISNSEVSFGKLARFFRDGLKARNALYFDGSVSSLWDPANGRQDAFVPLGPMVVVLKPAESTPGRGARARP